MRTIEVTGGPRRSQPDSARQMGRGGSENVAAMKGAAERIQAVLGVAQLDGALEARGIGGEGQQAIIGSDENCAGSGFDRDREPISADAGIDHADKNGAAAGNSASFAQGRSRPAVTFCGGIP